MLAQRIIIEVDQAGAVSYGVKVFQGGLSTLHAANACHIAGANLLAEHGLRPLLTDEEAAEAAKPVVLPPGWEATLDGVGISVDAGDLSKQSYSRTYRRDDFADAAESVRAPCGPAPDGVATPATVAALAAYDTEHPRANRKARRGKKA